MDIRETYCCFLDILGFSRIISDWQKATQYYSAFVSDLIPETFAMLNALKAVVSGTLEEGPIEYVQWKIVSDSIIITSDDIVELIMFSCELSYKALLKGYILRGGIGFGFHAEEQSDRGYIVVSQALTEAYMAESQVADVPRIIFTDRALDTFPKTRLLADGGGNIYSATGAFDIIMQSEDNRWFVNPFHSCYLHGDGLARKRREIIRPYLDDPRESKHLHKYLWLADVHNINTVPGCRRRHMDAYYNNKIQFLELLRSLYVEDTEFSQTLIPTWEYSDTYNSIYIPHRVPYSEATNMFANTFQENTQEVLPSG